MSLISDGYFSDLLSVNLMLDFEYGTKELLQTEKNILKFLDWNITIRTCREFVTMMLDLITKDDTIIHISMVINTQKLFIIMKLLCDISLFSVELITENPSYLAGNIIAIANMVNGNEPDYARIRSILNREGTIAETSFIDKLVGSSSALKILKILKPLVLRVVTNNGSNNRMKDIYLQVHKGHEKNILSIVHKYFFQ